MPLHADLIVFNGRLLTMDAHSPRASAMAVRRGIIEAVGDDASVRTLAGPGTVMIDLDGRCVTPGFHDCHVHLLWTGKLLTGAADLVGCRSIDELCQRVSTFAGDGTGWIRGFGFDQEQLAERRFPTRVDLDRMSSTRPIVLSRVCGHAAVANSAAIALLSDAEREAGDADSGLFTETAISAFYDRFPEPDDDALEAALLAACELALRTGITSVQTLLDSADDLKVYTRLKNKLSRLPIRVVAIPPESAADALFAHGIVTGFGDEWLRVGGAKFFSDGSLGARTALLSSPYADDVSMVGEQIYPPGVMQARMRAVARMGFQIVVHAIGDAALRESIDGIEGALAGDDNRLARHRVEHASVCPPDQLARLARLHIPTTLQPQFVTSDSWTGDRLGPHRAAWAYPFASLLAAHVPIGLSSDSPVEKLDAFACLGAAVGRHAWSPGETLTPLEAIHAYTLGSAYCAHRERHVGSLEIGKFADFVVLSGDPTSMDATAIRSLKAEQVFVNGELRAGPVMSHAANRDALAT